MKAQLLVFTVFAATTMLGENTHCFNDFGRYYPSGDAGGFAIADFNHDGILDVAVARGSDQKPYRGALELRFGFGDEGGNLTAPTIYQMPRLAGATDLAAADFNNDGNLDLVIVGDLAGRDAVTIALGNGDGTFQFNWRRFEPAGLYSVTTGDFNHDGYVDVAASNLQEGTFYVFLGNGDGTLAPSRRYSSSDQWSWKVMAADFNRDGNLDLAVLSGTYPSNLSVSLGNGDGTFRPVVVTDIGFGSARSMATGDFNEDGTPDIAVVDSVAPEEDILLGNGDGTFQPPEIYEARYNYDVAVADLNFDQHLDLVALDPGYHTEWDPPMISIQFGNGDGTFSPVFRYAEAVYTMDHIALADMNGDGLVDYVTTGLYNTLVTLGIGCEGPLGKPQP
jgi:hypothetical protein